MESAPEEADEKRRDSEAEELLEELAREVTRFAVHEWWEVEAEERRLEDAAATEPADSHRSALLAHRSQQRYVRLPSPMLSLGMAHEVSWAPPGISGDRSLLDEWRFPGDHIDGGHSLASQKFHGAGSIRPGPIWPCVVPGDGYTALPPVWPGRPAFNEQVEDGYVVYLAKNEQMLLHTLFQGPPDASDAVAKVIVRYALALMEDSHGHRLLGLVLDHCNHALRDPIVARITRDKKRFFSICVDRSDEVVRMIRSCGSWKSFKLLKSVIMSWMLSPTMQDLVMDSSRFKVVQAFVQCAPPCLSAFIFEAIAKNCIAIACRPTGVYFLQNCLEHVNEMEKDYILTEVSYSSIHLAQNPYGNYILQDVLKQRDASRLAIIASCFRHNYVKLSRNKYSSNVVETCLDVFDDEERCIIVNELICYPGLRDLVTHKYANYVISAALRTCKVPLLHMLANAILSLESINRRHPHCLRIFHRLVGLGYIQWRNIFHSSSVSEEADPVYCSSSEDDVKTL